jgi:hypothetical protein
MWHKVWSTNEDFDADIEILNTSKIHYLILKTTKYESFSSRSLLVYNAV